jgi:hypothetical protein
MGLKVDQSANSILIIADDIVAQPAEGYNEDTRSSDGVQATDKATGLPVWGLRCAVMHGANQLSKKIKIIAAEQPSGFIKGGLLTAHGLDINLYEMNGKKGWSVSADSVTNVGAPVAPVASSRRSSGE